MRACTGTPKLCEPAQATNCSHLKPQVLLQHNFKTLQLSRQLSPKDSLCYSSFGRDRGCDTFAVLGNTTRHRLPVTQLCTLPGTLAYAKAQNFGLGVSEP